MRCCSYGRRVAALDVAVSAANQKADAEEMLASIRAVLLLLLALPPPKPPPSPDDLEPISMNQPPNAADFSSANTNQKPQHNQCRPPFH